MASNHINRTISDEIELDKRFLFLTQREEVVDKRENELEQQKLQFTQQTIDTKQQLFEVQQGLADTKQQLFEAQQAETLHELEVQKKLDQYAIQVKLDIALAQEQQIKIQQEKADLKEEKAQIDEKMKILSELQQQFQSQVDQQHLLKPNHVYKLRYDLNFNEAGDDSTNELSEEEKIHTFISQEFSKSSQALERLESRGRQLKAVAKQVQQQRDENLRREDAHRKHVAEAEKQLKQKRIELLENIRRRLSLISRCQLNLQESEALVTLDDVQYTHKFANKH